MAGKHGWRQNEKTLKQSLKMTMHPFEILSNTTFFPCSDASGQSQTLLYADTVVIDNAECTDLMDGTDPSNVIGDGHLCAYDGVSVMCTVSKQCPRPVSFHMNAYLLSMLWYTSCNWKLSIFTILISDPWLWLSDSVPLSGSRLHAFSTLRTDLLSTS